MDKGSSIPSHTHIRSELVNALLVMTVFHIIHTTVLGIVNNSPPRRIGFRSVTEGNTILRSVMGLGYALAIAHLTRSVMEAKDEGRGVAMLIGVVYGLITVEGD